MWQLLSVATVVASEIRNSIRTRGCPAAVVGHENDVVPAFALPPPTTQKSGVVRPEGLGGLAGTILSAPENLEVALRKTIDS